MGIKENIIIEIIKGNLEEFKMEMFKAETESKAEALKQTEKY